MSTENQNELIGYDNVLPDAIDLTKEDHRWPEAMRQMYDILNNQLAENGIDNQTVALQQLQQICKAFGGMQFYLPRGRALESAIKSFQIWEDFKGNNVAELAQKYNVSMQHVWRVIARMREREKQKRQPNLF